MRALLEKRVRERSRPLYELMRAVDNALARALLNQTRPCTCVLFSNVSVVEHDCCHLLQNYVSRMYVF